MLVTLVKNVDKNVGNTPKNVDEKLVTTLPENVDGKCSQHFQKMLIEKILTTVKKTINKKTKKSKCVVIGGAPRLAAYTKPPKWPLLICLWPKQPDSWSIQNHRHGPCLSATGPNNL
jgi:hypothetical protein